MKIGVTGHQKREGADWNWVRMELARLLNSFEPPLEGVTSLAEGADQLFAEAVLAAGGMLRVVIPAADYETNFKGVALERFLSLRQRALVEETLRNRESNENAFLQAGQRIVDEADLLIAVWDGMPARGIGGTADVVAYARARGKRVVRLNPVTRNTDRSV